MDNRQLINKTCKPTTNKRPNPVDPMVCPGPTHDSRPKRRGWVHGCSIENTKSQNIRSNDEPNRNRCNRAQAILIGANCCGIHRIHQPECHHHLQHQCIPYPNSTRKSKNRYELIVSKERWSYLSAGDYQKKKAGAYGSKELCNEVHQAVEKADLADDEEAKGDSRVDVTYRAVGSTNGYGHEESERVCEGSSHEAFESCAAVAGDFVDGDGGA
ncbi:hypothetical protein RIF29_15688 [Crotalaria pallida]|uniref:Uncharacterized protein n=1 Tax=Crotalaria pallida TaxID=3830 RepID=A0AAN9FDZ4_CROPI